MQNTDSLGLALGEDVIGSTNQFCCKLYLKEDKVLDLSSNFDWQIIDKA
jgi:hypothetical protein